MSLSASRCHIIRLKCAKIRFSAPPQEPPPCLGLWPRFSAFRASEFRAFGASLSPQVPLFPPTLGRLETHTNQWVGYKNYDSRSVSRCYCFSLNTTDCVKNKAEKYNTKVKFTNWRNQLTPPLGARSVCNIRRCCDLTSLLTPVIIVYSGRYICSIFQTVQ